MGHGGDVIAELTTDHREVNDLFKQFSEAPPGSEDHKSLVDAALMIELVRDSVTRVPLSGRARATALAYKGLLADHARVEQLLDDLQYREPADLDFDGF